jgi:anti-sigma factor RsiW
VPGAPCPALAQIEVPPLAIWGNQIAMDHDEIRRHIEAASTRSLAPRILRDARQEDRLDRAALGWLRRWRPARAAAAVPVCSCAAGRCSVCN